MDLAVAWLVFPALLLALCCGCGLLVASLCRCAPPPALIPACGFALIVCVGQLLTLADATAELTAPVVVGLAVAGAGFALPLKPDRALLPAAGTALAVFAVFAAPIVLSGEATLAGFIKLDDTATWLTLTDRIMEHGRSLDGLAPSSYEATLAFNLGKGYPIGVFVPFGVGVSRLGTDAAWLIQPYMALLAAMLALSLWSLAGQVTESRPWRAVAAFLGAQSALLFGYYLWGGVKEIAAALLVATAAALAGRLLTSGGGPRRVIPLVVASAALAGVLSAGGLAWLAPILLPVAVLLARDVGLAAAARDAAVYLAGLALLSLPIVTPGGLIPPTSSPLTDAAAKGNLIRPLEPEQVLGVWPSGDFRVDPSSEALAYILMAIVATLAVCGWFALSAPPAKARRFTWRPRSRAVSCWSRSAHPGWRARRSQRPRPHCLSPPCSAPDGSPRGACALWRSPAPAWSRPGCCGRTPSPTATSTSRPADSSRSSSRSASWSRTRGPP